LETYALKAHVAIDVDAIDTMNCQCLSLSDSDPRPRCDISCPNMRLFRKNVIVKFGSPFVNNSREFEFNYLMNALDQQAKPYY
jgi:hypothetical protein